MVLVLTISNSAHRVATETGMQRFKGASAACAAYIASAKRSLGASPIDLRMTFDAKMLAPLVLGGCSFVAYTTFD